MTRVGAARRGRRAGGDAGQAPDPDTLRTAVLHLLHELTRRAPGRTVELRVPPYGAVQCDQSTGSSNVDGPPLRGPKHRRGTPPNVVETDPLTWLLLATGRLSWEQARVSGRLSSSGVRADISVAVSQLWP